MYSWATKQSIINTETKIYEVHSKNIVKSMIFKKYFFKSEVLTNNKQKCYLDIKKQISSCSFENRYRELVY